MASGLQVAPKLKCTLTPSSDGPLRFCNALVGKGRKIRLSARKNGPVAHAQLAHQVHSMDFNGAHTETQLFGDLIVGISLSDEAHDFNRTRG
jgi:hypothetical protein